MLKTKANNLKGKKKREKTKKKATIELVSLHEKEALTRDLLGERKTAV